MTPLDDRSEAAMLPRWGLLVLSIFAWCTYVNGATTRPVNCEKYVFHRDCRGSQAKKRVMKLAADYDKAEPACICPSLKKVDSKVFGSLSSSNILSALLDEGLDVNTIYDAYTATTSADRRGDYNTNRDRSSPRKKLLHGSLIKFTTKSLDEDY